MPQQYPWEYDVLTVVYKPHFLSFVVFYVPSYLLSFIAYNFPKSTLYLQCL
uniref:Uncharacterized protein n=1 Tax=Ciona intestinalis TaxID=7719 RepID=F6SLM4_CIOIN